MFWLMRLRVLDPPMPPIPTVAILTVSLGAWNPLPSTWRGTIVGPAPVAATVVTNFRRVMPSFMIFPFRTLYSEGTLARCPRFGQGTRGGGKVKGTSGLVHALFSGAGYSLPRLGLAGYDCRRGGRAKPEDRSRPRRSVRD